MSDRLGERCGGLQQVSETVRPSGVAVSSVGTARFSKRDLTPRTRIGLSDSIHEPVHNPERVPPEQEDTQHPRDAQHSGQQAASQDGRVCSHELPQNSSHSDAGGKEKNATCGGVDSGRHRGHAGGVVKRRTRPVTKYHPGDNPCHVRSREHDEWEQPGDMIQPRTPVSVTWSTNVRGDSLVWVGIHFAADPEARR